MNKNLLLPVISFLLFFSYQYASAQEECAFLLKRAEKMYESGTIESVPELLSSCIASGFTKEERIQAYRLLVLVYLFEDKKKDAEKEMLNLLKYNPEYQLSATDPSEFIYLYKSYRTSPIYSFGFFVGTNFTTVRLMNEYGIYNINKSEVGYTIGNPGFQLGLTSNNYVYNKIELNLNLFWKFCNYKYNNTLWEFTSVTYHETQNRIELPVTLTYEFGHKNLKPYIRGGGSIEYLLSAKTQATRSYLDNSKAPVTGPDISVIDLRKPLSYSLIIGIGCKYRIKGGYFIFDLRNDFGLTNQALSASRFNNSELIFKYYYLDNDFKIDNISLNIGFIKSIYRPKKIK